MQLQATVTKLELLGDQDSIIATIHYFDPYNDIAFTVNGVFSKESDIPKLGDKFTITINKAVPLPLYRPPPTPMPSDGT
jgi:hypothetical protein